MSVNPEDFKVQVLRREEAALSSLKLDPKNVRLHPEENLDSIERSMRRWGQVQPLVIYERTQTIVGGNGRFVAMQKIGFETAHCWWVDGEEHEVRALAIALNKTAELATWDYRGLSEALADLKPFEALAATGFRDFEIEPLTSAVWTPPEVKPLPGHQNTTASGHSIALSGEQWEIFSRAAARLGETKSHADALVAICKKFLKS